MYEEKDCIVNIRTLCAQTGWNFIQGSVLDVQPEDKVIVYEENDVRSEISFAYCSINVGSRTLVPDCLKPNLRSLTSRGDVIWTRPIRELRGRVVSLQNECWLALTEPALIETIIAII
jgi:hypothetical protein